MRDKWIKILDEKMMMCEKVCYNQEAFDMEMENQWFPIHFNGQQTSIKWKCPNLHWRLKFI